jgi:selenide, water dikinase
VLEGGRSICSEAGIPLAGGHTIDSLEPIFGLAVTGVVHPKNMKTNSGAREGDLLFLTKPLGVGVLSTAIKRGVLKEGHYNVLIRQLTSLNSIGEEAGRMSGVHAMTDVTGFGLLGHATEMGEGSGVSIELDFAAIKKTEGFDEYVRLQSIPGATARNWSSYGHKVEFEKPIDEALIHLLADPQTNGGLLIAVSPGATSELKTLFQKNHLHEHLMPVGKGITSWPIVAGDPAWTPPPFPHRNSLPPN